MTRTRISIERGTGEPLYRQLRLALEQEIAVGALDAAQPLPSSRDLARQLGLSRNTVNTAYLELQAEGLVDALPRRGLFVNPDMVAEIRRRRVEGTPRAAVDWSGHVNPRLDAGIPEIAKVRDWATRPFPFVAGQVSESSFPRLAWSRALREALDPPHLQLSLRDGIDEDDPLLVEQLCRRILPTRGIVVDPAQVLVTQGSQQGLDLLARTLLGPDSVVGVEDPGYLDVRHIVRQAGARLRPLPVDGAGLVPVADLGGVDLLHLTPSHQSPTNVTLTLGRRRTLLAQAGEADTLIIEDDYDSEFRYLGGPTPAMKALPDSDRVIYLGTFSKFLAPGLRLGYLVADPELVAELRSRRRYSIRHPSGHLQRAMALLIDSGQYQRAVGRRRAQLALRWTTLRDALRAELPWPVDPPPGGVSIWVSGPPELDWVDVAAEALEQGVVVERGDIYFTDQSANRHHVRLGFDAIAPDAIEPGVAILGRLVRRRLAG